MSDIERAIVALEKLISGEIGLRNIHKTVTLPRAITALRAQLEREEPEPLTLEELREMDGKPVWIVWIGNESSQFTDPEYALVDSRKQKAESLRCIYRFEYYGKTWLAYRQPPKEVHHEHRTRRPLLQSLLRYLP